MNQVKKANLPKRKKPSVATTVIRRESLIPKIKGKRRITNEQIKKAIDKVICAS
jgi:hypothetical protein